ncbi:MAG: indole-3-glycerol phosphate synthase TrpC [Microcystaceae cyanobacterium]
MQIRRRPPNPSVNVENLQYRVKVPNADPNHILEEIVWYKEKEVNNWRQKLPLLELQKQVLTVPPSLDFLAALTSGKTEPALIAEVKKASPSKGIIREDFDPVAIAKTYAANGASCLSVLTDEKFFQGSFTNLELVRETVEIPLLCKEFIIYPYQLYLARCKGADAVLLIAAILSDRDLQYFIKITQKLGLTPLIEVHTLAELDRVLSLEGVSLIGINNRNLENFTVDLNTTCQLLEARGEQIRQRNIVVISESGIHTAEDLQIVQQAGANGVLIGESLVKQPDPGQAIRNLFRLT